MGQNSDRVLSQVQYYLVRMKHITLHTLEYKHFRKYNDRLNGLLVISLKRIVFRFSGGKIRLTLSSSLMRSKNEEIHDLT